jgi:uncharacterized NAD(P)/FAD-binding protein YdhS
MTFSPVLCHLGRIALISRAGIHLTVACTHLHRQVRPREDQATGFAKWVKVG